MITALLTAFLVIQGVPLAAQQGGTVTGLLKNADGRPAFGIRVAALARPESPMEAITGAALASIASTDEEGRYRLEDIPLGQYYIVAGRVDLPTYYPGTPQMSAGTIVKIAPGVVLAGLDFAISDNSIRTEATDTYSVPVGRRSVLIRVLAEGGGNIPVSSSTGPVMLEFERTADGAITTIPVTATSTIMEFFLGLNVTEFQLTMKNLPEGHVVRSIMSGSTDITASTLKIPGMLNPSAGVQGPVPPLTVLLAAAPAPAGNSGGVRVTGIDRPGDTHPVYLSGTQGIVFSDGTFEFRSVPPGRHTIAAIDLPGRARGTTVVVGEQNLDNVALTGISTLPSDIQTPTSPGPTGGRPAGSTFAPVTLRARVVEEKSKQPGPAGQVYINDRSGPAYSLDADGRFAIQNLLPGIYSVEILMFGYSTVNQEITVGVENLEVELTSKKLY